MSSEGRVLTPGSVEHRTQALRDAVASALVGRKPEDGDDYSHEAWMIHMILAEKGYTLRHHSESAPASVQSEADQ